MASSEAPWEKRKEFNQSVFLRSVTSSQKDTENVFTLFLD